jgi:thioesterase domain-containing protein/acyl carrier protein
MSPTDPALEIQLSAIWADILSIPPPAPEADFFQLGGDSRRATRIFIEIERRLGIHLPRAVLLENNTVRKLAAYIAGASQDRPKYLVALRSKGTWAPLFLIPGGFGDVFYLGSLARYIESDRPVYGLQAPSVDSGRSYDTLVEQTASEYLSEILKLQPAGPCHLVGHSFGGLITLEIARLLSEQGRKVAFLGLLDTYPPGPRRQASLPERLLIHWHNLRQLQPGQLFPYFRDRWISLLLRLSRFAPVRRYLGRIRSSPNKKNMLVSTISRVNYAPPPYPGDLSLFVVTHRPWYIRWDPMQNWRKFIQGHLEIHPVQGEHGSLLSEPHVRDLARQLNACLCQAEADQQARSFV